MESLTKKLVDRKLPEGAIFAIQKDFQSLMGASHGGIRLTGCFEEVSTHGIGLVSSQPACRNASLLPIPTTFPSGWDVQSAHVPFWSRPEIA